jgi:hypothetical protein
MITTQNLSKRIFQFFDSLFLTNKTSFGFSSVSTQAFIEGDWNQRFRPNEDQALHNSISSLLFYHIDQEMMGTGIQSVTIKYDPLTRNEILESIQDLEVTVDILSKSYHAKDAIKFLDFAMQSERKQDACYGTSYDFDLILYKVSNEINLTALEKGAWAERMQKKLYFKYIDTFTFDEVKTLQKPTSIETVKDIYQYTLNVKES